MKTPRDGDPLRWRERAASGAAPIDESRAAVLADAAVQVQPLGPQVLSRIRHAVLARRADGRSFRRFLLSGGLSTGARFAIGFGLVLVCAATAGGATVLWRRYLRSPARVATSAGEARRVIPHRPTRPSSAADHPGAFSPPDQAPEPPPSQAALPVAEPPRPSPAAR